MRTNNDSFFNPIKLPYGLKPKTRYKINETPISDIQFTKIREYYVRKRDGADILDEELKQLTSCSFQNKEKFAFVVFEDNNLSHSENFVIQEKKRKV